MVEINLGVIAGSIPMLRKLVGWLAEEPSSARASRKEDAEQFNLVTIGRVMLRRGGHGETRLRTPSPAESGMRRTRREHSPGTSSARTTSEVSTSRILSTMSRHSVAALSPVAEQTTKKTKTSR